MIAEEFIQYIRDTKSVSCTSVANGQTINTVLDVAYAENYKIYFLINRDSSFYHALLEYQNISININQGSKGATLCGRIKEIDHSFLKTILANNKVLGKEYKGKASESLAIMQVYSWNGTYFSLNSSGIYERQDFFHDREDKEWNYGFFQIKHDKCNQCGRCLSDCPQRCIDMDKVVIWANNCVRCGSCYFGCPSKCIENATEKK
ncbi:MAG: hypothetical protein HUJ61_03110 [Bacilli bacterium]|nr:hypothetical protein [Bacilli bacterium]